MILGFLSAATLLLTFFFTETVWAVLPLPWRLIPWAFIFSLAIMHRVSFELGGAFLLVTGLATVAVGLAPAAHLLVVLASLVIVYGLISRVFARRSIAAFAGVVLVTSLLYFTLRFGVVVRVPGFFPWMFLFLTAVTSLLTVIASLFLERALHAFGRRFVAKNDTYEVQAPR